MVQSSVHNESGHGRVQGKVAFVTGGASGIGKASVLRLIEEGAHVSILDRNEERLHELKRDVAKRYDQELFTIEADVTQSADVQEAIAQTVEHYGQLDVVFANAGVNGVFAPIEDISAEEWEQTHAINLKGTFLTVKHAIPYMKDKGGSMIITSSINGNRTFTTYGSGAYSASKAGQVAFAKMAALELSGYQIRVNVICPGYIKSNIMENTDGRNVDKIRIPVKYPSDRRIPLTGEPGDAAEVGNTVLFLASDESKHITGTELYVDGAESLLR